MFDNYKLAVSRTERNRTSNRNNPHAGSVRGAVIEILPVLEPVHYLLLLLLIANDVATNYGSTLRYRGLNI